MERCCGRAAAQALFDVACLCLLDPKRGHQLLFALAASYRSKVPSELNGDFCSYLTGQPYYMQPLGELVLGLSATQRTAVAQALINSSLAAQRYVYAQSTVQQKGLVRSLVDPMLSHYDQLAPHLSPVLLPRMPLPSFCALKIPQLKLETSLGQCVPLYLMSLALQPNGLPSLLALISPEPRAQNSPDFHRILLRRALAQAQLQVSPVVLQRLVEVWEQGPVNLAAVKGAAEARRPFILRVPLQSFLGRKSQRLLYPLLKQGFEYQPVACYPQLQRFSVELFVYNRPKLSPQVQVHRVVHPKRAAYFTQYYQHEAQRFWEILEGQRPRTHLTPEQQQFNHAWHLVRRKVPHIYRARKELPRLSHYEINEQALKHLVQAQSQQVLVSSAGEFDPDAVYRTFAQKERMLKVMGMCLAAALGERTNPLLHEVSDHSFEPTGPNAALAQLPERTLSQIELNNITPFIFLGTVVTALMQTLHYRVEEARLQLEAQGAVNAAVARYLDNVPLLLRFMAAEIKLPEPHKDNQRRYAYSKGRRALQRQLWRLLTARTRSAPKPKP